MKTLSNAKYSLAEKILLGIDSSLRMLSGNATSNASHTLLRANPADSVESAPLSTVDTAATVSMLRVNHSGEVCAQALYRGQALFARDRANSAKLLQAAQEETEHLTWCKQRLDQLQGNPSIFNPLWYAGSFAMGAVAGGIGDEFSFSFLAETELQVSEHLAKHLERVALSDQKTRAILAQMQEDELKHATTALDNGGKNLSWGVKVLMRATAKIMTVVAGKM